MQALVLLRNRGQLDPLKLMPLLFRLFRCAAHWLDTHAAHPRAPHSGQHGMAWHGTACFTPTTMSGLVWVGGGEAWRSKQQHALAGIAT